MNELRCAVVSMQAYEDGAYPVKDQIEQSSTQVRRNAEEVFGKWLADLPSELQNDAENHTVMLANAWADSGYERGFIAGARMMIQLLTR